MDDKIGDVYNRNEDEKFIKFLKGGSEQMRQLWET
jgi:hypothetical protein